MGSLWGTYDEKANASAFQESLDQWRTAGKPAGVSFHRPKSGMSSEDAGC